MSTLLEKAFDKASKLPPKEQEYLGAVILEELASERAWAEAFARSQEKLFSLADEALAEFRRGETRPLDYDKLVSQI